MIRINPSESEKKFEWQGTHEELNGKLSKLNGRQDWFIYGKYLFDEMLAKWKVGDVIFHENLFFRIERLDYKIVARKTFPYFIEWNKADMVENADLVLRRKA